MSTKLITILLLLCLASQIVCKFVSMIDKFDVEPEEPSDLEEERKMCFCCRAFVCRHQSCPCSRFTALF
ncbi:unnamed protein product [Caenorhabditis brenneri]